MKRTIYRFVTVDQDLVWGQLVGEEWGAYPSASTFLRREAEEDAVQFLTQFPYDIVWVERSRDGGVTWEVAF